MTTVTCDETKHKTYTVPFGQCALHTSVYEPNFVDMHHNALICLGEFNKKDELSKISERKTFLIVPGGHTLKFLQGNRNSYIISPLASALYYM